MSKLPTTVRLKSGDAGKRVEHVLARALPELKETFVLLLLHQGKVRLGDQKLERGARVPGEGVLEVRSPDPRSGPKVPAANSRIALSVVHDDADTIVVVKPAGLPMHPGPQHGSDTLQNALVAHFPELLELGPDRGYGLVSRLDRHVSGLVVVARSVRAHEALVEAFSGREVEKRYRALVVGEPKAREGTVSTPVEDRDALTRFKVVESGAYGSEVVSLAELEPETGRKHQLRIHMASIGLPILGDRDHGASTLRASKRLGLKRVALHAGELAFVHPTTKERVRFETPWSSELDRVWKICQGKKPRP